MQTRVPSISEDISIARGRLIATRSCEFGDCEISGLEIRDAAASNASRESDFSIEPGDGRKIEARRLLAPNAISSGPRAYGEKEEKGKTLLELTQR